MSGWSLVALLILFLSMLQAGLAPAITVAGFAWWFTLMVQRFRRAQGELQKDVKELQSKMADLGEPTVAPSPSKTSYDLYHEPDAEVFDEAAFAPDPPQAPRKDTSEQIDKPATATLSAAQRHPPKRLFTLDWDKIWQVIAGPLGNESQSRLSVAEVHIGSVWFSRIGGVLLIIGTFFLYRYGPLSNLARTLIGYTAGVLLWGFGHWGHTKGYRLWAQAIFGAGLGVLYMTTHAAANLFSPPVISQPLAFALTTLTTALGTGMSVYYNSFALGLLGMAGGFAIPFVLISGEASFTVLFTYMLILVTSLLAVAYYKRWLLYNSLVFVMTWAVYSLWRVTNYSTTYLWQAFLFATAFFLLFALIAVVYQLLHRTKARAADITLSSANAFIYFGTGLGLFQAVSGGLQSAFAFGLAAVYVGLGCAAIRRNQEDRMLWLSFFGLGFVFATIALPVALHGPWLTLAWALEGSMLVWVGFLSQTRECRGSGLVALGLAFIRLMLMETFPHQFGASFPVLPLRALTFLGSAIAIGLAVWAYRRFRGAKRIQGCLAVAGNGVVLWYLTLETVLHYTVFSGFDAIMPTTFVVIAAVWSGYGFLISLADMWFCSPAVRRGSRLVLSGALFLLAGTLSTVGWAVPAVERWTTFVLVFFSLWGAEFFYRRRSLHQGNGTLSLVANCVAYFLLAFQTYLFVRLHTSGPFSVIASTGAFAVASTWGAYSLLAMAVGGNLHSIALRLMAAAQHYFTILFVALVAVPNLLARPALHLAAFVMVVIGGYVSAFLASCSSVDLYKKATVTGTALGVTVLTAWWGSAELARYFSGAAFDAFMPHVAVLVWLGLLALAVGRSGVWFNASEARWAALAMQTVMLCGLILTMALGFAAAGWLRLWLFGGTVVTVYASHRVFHTPQRSPLENRVSLILSLCAAAISNIWLALEIKKAIVIGAGLASGAPGESVVLYSISNHWILGASAIYGFILALIGLCVRAVEFRLLGMTVQGLAALGLLTIGLSNMAAPNSLRFGACGVVFGGVYALTWVLHRFPARNRLWERITSQNLALGTAAFTVVCLFFQVQRFVQPYLLQDPRLTYLQDFIISGAWGLYGFLVLAVGFVLKHRSTRLLGVAILGLTLLKIGLSDIWSLNVFARIWITLGLGVIFLVSSLMYQRFNRFLLGERDPAERNTDPIDRGV